MKTILTPAQSDQLLDLCTDWAEDHPEWVARLAKARMLLINGGVIPNGVKAWRVKGSTGWHQVTVIASRGHCDCKWWYERKERCSHLLAAALHYELFPSSSPEPPKNPSPSLNASLARLEELRRVSICSTLAA